MSTPTKCIICGKLIEKNHAYCDEHRAYAEQDDKILEEAPLELLFSLIAGIFTRARVDYMLNTDHKKKDAELFFRSDWAQELSLSRFDPDEVIKMMDEEVEDGTNWIRSDIVKREWQ